MLADPGIGPSWNWDATMPLILIHATIGVGAIAILALVGRVVLDCR
jgi:hypothetical protein